MTNYLNTLITEKGLNREMILEVQGQSGLNIMPLGVVLDNISATSKEEQKAIKNANALFAFGRCFVLMFHQKAYSKTMQK